MKLNPYSIKSGHDGMDSFIILSLLAAFFSSVDILWMQFRAIRTDRMTQS